MANSDPPQLSATFFPTSFEDFSMPELVDYVSPKPQRSEELPERLNDSLARMDVNAVPRSSTNTSAGTRPPSEQPSVKPSMQVVPSAPRKPAERLDSDDLLKLPTLVFRTPNVPPSDDEKERTLETARLPVLSSSDPEVQLAWAQDALTFVDTHSADHLQASKFVQDTLQQLQEDGTNIVNFLADQRHPKALFMKGMWLEFGKFGYSQNRADGFRCYRRAAERGYSRAEYRMGMQFESTNESIKALQHYKAGEVLGDSASCYRMGMTYLLGQLGQPLDIERGLQLIKYAADAADENTPQGAYVYGMLLCGELEQIKLPSKLLPLDVTGGKQYIERAAFLGFSKAQLRMGSAYELCTLQCEFSPLLSVHYNALAAMQGEPEAQMALSRWFLCGHEPDFIKNEALAYKFAHMAATLEFPTAEFALGYFHEVGIYVPSDLESARDWYQKAAAKGNKEAASRIEGISMARTLSMNDHEKVAINRIRSTHGSMRVARPMGISTPSVPDVVAEESTQQRTSYSPTPSSIYTQISVSDHRPASSTTSVTSQPPRRSDVSAMSAKDRPVTSTPYPLDDAPPPIEKYLAHKPSAEIPKTYYRSSSSNLASHIPAPPTNIRDRSPGNRQVSAAVGRQPARPPQPPARPPKESLPHHSDPRSRSSTRPMRQMRNAEIASRSSIQPAAPGPPPPTIGASRPSPHGSPQLGPRGRPQQTGPALVRQNRTPPSRTSPPRQAPPKRGPQTFEEMGVPLGKPNNDCILM